MQYKNITDRTIGYKFEITITTTNLSVVGSGPMWAPVKSDMRWEMKKIKKCPVQDTNTKNYANADFVHNITCLDN